MTVCTTNPPPTLYVNNKFEKKEFTWEQKTFKVSDSLPKRHKGPFGSKNIVKHHSVAFVRQLENICIALGSLEQTSYKIRISVGNKDYVVPDQLQQIDWNPKDEQGKNLVHFKDTQNPEIGPRAFQMLTGLGRTQLLRLVEDLHRPVNQHTGGKKVVLDLTEGSELVELLSLVDLNLKEEGHSKYLDALKDEFSNRPSRQVVSVNNDGQKLLLAHPKANPSIQSSIHCCGE